MTRRKFWILNVIIFFYFRPKIVADLFTHKNDLNLVPSNIAIRGYLGIFISATSRKMHLIPSHFDRQVQQVVVLQRYLLIVKCSNLKIIFNKIYNFYFLWVKIKKINIFYHFPQYESLWIVLFHYDLCWFLVVYGFYKSTWTWSGKTVLFRGRSWKNPLEHQRRCHGPKKTIWTEKITVF